MRALVVGAELGPTAWLEIAQERIDAFATATGDEQSIHVDPVAAAAGPFGTTVAHGFLTLSLVVRLWNEVAPVDPDFSGVTLNYGLNRVRFPAPVPAGSRIRGRFRVEDVQHVSSARQTLVGVTVEREGSEKPVCVAELLLRFLP